MKTSRFAMTLDSGRVFDSRAQACGFVSTIIVSKDGGTPAHVSCGHVDANAMHTFFSPGLAICRIYCVHNGAWAVRLPLCLQSSLFLICGTGPGE